MADLTELAEAVDAAERECDAADAINMTWDEGYRELVDRLIAAKDDYFDALRKPWLDEQKELDRAKFVRLSAKRVDRLRREMEEAQRHLATFKCIERWLYTSREFLEAQAADEAAQGRYEFFYGRYWKAFGDRDAGIKVKRWKTQTVDGVTYALAGVKKIAGERRALWEKVI